jgi:hypothetical protein
LWWVLPGLVIVVGLMWSSLVLPRRIREARGKLRDPSRYLTMDDLAELERTRYTFRGWLDDPLRGVFAVGATYAMLDRRDTAEAAVGYAGWSNRLLPREDSLLWQLYEQDLMRAAMQRIQERADDAESYRPVLDVLAVVVRGRYCALGLDLRVNELRTLRSRAIALRE